MSGTVLNVLETREGGDNPPPGYLQLPFGDGFLAHNGPVYAKRSEGEIVFGCRIAPHLCNPMGVVHGGWVATMLDFALPLTARYAAGFHERFLLTIQLSVDYLAGARMGDWVEARAQVLRTTKRMVFMQGLLEANGEPIARGSGIFRIGPPAPPVEVEQIVRTWNPGIE